MLHSIARVKFIMSSFSNGWLFWSGSYTSISWNSELNVFKKIWFVGKISIKLPNGFLEQKCTRPLNAVDNHYCQYHNELTLLL